MKRVITAFCQDEEGDWIAVLNCGHTQHVRHDLPWQNRPWVTTAEGRRAYLGSTLECAECLTS